MPRLARCCLIVPVVLMLASNWASAHEPLYWYDITCQHRVAAIVWDVQETTVVLRANDGRLLSIAKSRLCDANVAYLDAYEVTIQAANELGQAPYTTREQELDDLRNLLLSHHFPPEHVGHVTAPRSPAADRNLQQLCGRTVVIRGLPYQVKRVNVSPRLTGIEELEVKLDNSSSKSAVVFPEHVDRIFILPGSHSRSNRRYRLASSDAPFRRRGPPSNSPVISRYPAKYTLVYDPVHSVWTDPKSAAAHRLLARAKTHWQRSAELYITAEARWRVQRGKAYARRGLLEDAVHEFTIAIQLAPTSAEAYLRRGIAFSDLAKNQSALSDLDRVIALASDGQNKSNLGVTLAGLEARALVRSAEKLHDAAIDDAERTIALSSSDYSEKYHNLLFNIRMQAADDAALFTKQILTECERGGDPCEEQLEKAVANAKQAEHYNPNKTTDRYHRLVHTISQVSAHYLAEQAHAKFETKEIESAIAYARRAAARNPDSSEQRYEQALLSYQVHAQHVFLQQAKLAINDKEFTKAISLAKSAHSLGPDTGGHDTQQFLAHCYFTRATEQYFQRHKFDEAINDLTKSIELAPNVRSAYANRGQAYARLDRLSDSLLDLDRAIELGDQNDEVFLDRATIHARQGHPEKAIADITTAMGLNRNESFYPYYRAQLHFTLGGTQQAIEDTSEAIRRNSAHSDYYQFRARLRLVQKDFDAAENDARQALRLDPSETTVHALLRNVERKRRNEDPNYFDQEAVPSAITKLAFAVIADWAAKDGARNWSRAEDFWTRFGAGVQLVGGKWAKSKAIESAIDDVFPNLPAQDKIVVTNLTSQLVDAMLEGETSAVAFFGGTAEGVTVDTAIAFVENEYPNLGVAANAGSFLYELASEIKKQKN